MKRPPPDFKAARYVDIQKHWRRLGPIYQSEDASLFWKPHMREYLECRAEQYGFKPRHRREDQLPHDYDSCDWRCDRRGPHPAFWKFVCHSACHWLVDLGMFVSATAWPNVEWRIISSKKHSTVWNGDRHNPLLFDANFLALDVTPEEALRLAWPGKHLPIKQMLKGYL